MFVQQQHITQGLPIDMAGQRRVTHGIWCVCVVMTIYTS